MPQAVIPAAIGAVGSIGGALLSASAQKKAANQANAAQQEATQAQLQLGRESLGLNKDIYNSNYALLSPFVGNGLVASNSLNALLNLPQAPTLTSPLAQAPGGATPGTTGGTGGGASPYAGGGFGSFLYDHSNINYP